MNTLENDLMVAVEKNKPDDVRKAIASGADVNRTYLNEEYRFTPLFIAQIETARVLVEHGANINARDKNDDTALHWAIKFDDTVMARFLIDQGASLEAKNNKGQTPEDVASSAEMFDVLDEVIASKQASNIHQAINTHKEEHKTQRKI